MGTDTLNVCQGVGGSHVGPSVNEGGVPRAEEANWRERERKDRVGEIPCQGDSQLSAVQPRYHMGKREIIPLPPIPWLPFLSPTWRFAEGLKEGGELRCQEAQVSTDSSSRPTTTPPGSAQEDLRDGSRQPCRRTTLIPTTGLVTGITG